jgi:hypothetical protein
MSSTLTQNPRAYTAGYNLGVGTFARRLKTIRLRATEQGVRAGLRLVVQTLACYALYRPVHQGRYFTCAGQKYNYLSAALHTERVVEIPVAAAVSNQAVRSGMRVLEVGNVLSHYYQFEHDVLDKYEVGQGVVNTDVLDFEPAVKYQVIIAVSTLEHVGFDEESRDGNKFTLALNHLRSDCLAPGGKIVLTLPLGYNPTVDSWVFQHAHLEGRLAILTRESVMNTWHETPLKQLTRSTNELSFDKRFPGATAIAIWESGAQSLHE